jgi:amino acid adenylation domain-containing protein
MPFVLRLVGELCVSALERSLGELVDRHETFRTRFAAVDGMPVQIVEPTVAFSLVIVDLSELDPAAKNVEWKRRSSEEANRPFNLHETPLLRALLLRLGAEEHVLLLTIHHIAADGWSLGVFNRELSVLYKEFLQGRSSPLPRLPIQYADYAVWQRRSLTGNVLETHLNYWRQQLMGAPLQLTLPTDLPRPETASFKGDVLVFEIADSLCRSLRALAREEHATLFMVVLAAFQMLLGRYSGDTDIVVGSGIAGRTHAETEDLIGFFVNTVALRADLSGNPTFREFLRQVKTTALDAYAHQDMPFEQLVKELHPERALNRQPMFQVALALQNVPEEDLEFLGLKWTRVHAEQKTALFDLTLRLYEVEDGLRGEMEYTTDLYERESIERMADHFRMLLEQISEDSNVPIDHYSLMRTRDQRCLSDWSGSVRATSPADDVITVLEHRALYSGEAAAVSFGDLSVTYAGLNGFANRVARRLIAMGVEAGELVGVHMARGIENVVAFYGILKANAVYVPLDPSYPIDRLEEICRDAGIQQVLVDSRDRRALGPAKTELIEVSDRNSVDGQNLITSTEWGVAGARAAYAIYTSGSTGLPKGVLLHRRGLGNVLAAQRGTFRLKPSDRVLQLASPSFDASVFEFVLALGAGACLVTGTRDELLPGPEFSAFIRRQQISVMTITPSALASLSPGDSKYLRLLVVAGEELPAELARKWAKSCEVFNAYGPTETTIWATIHACSAEGVGGRVSIGKPIVNTKICLLNSALRPVSVGEVGELCVGGVGVALGYINRPKLTEERFVERPTIGSGRLYRTGDRARWRSDGSLEFLGRMDYQAKIRGHRIEPGEIEAALQEHDAVKQAVVIARDDPGVDRRLVAYLVADRSAAAGVQSPVALDVLRSDIVGEWERLYEDTYGAEEELLASKFYGWNSSYTGEPIPESEMEEWLSKTIERIKALRARRVLELGCGAGLVLRRIAPECEAYVGTDISAAALSDISEWMRMQGALNHVQLLHRSAAELDDVASESVDAVVLNSVVQYFPDVSYLMSVLTEAVRVVKVGGAIFIGDVRNYRLRRVFHSAVQLARAEQTDRVGTLKGRIRRAVAQDKELMIDPELFRALPGRVPGVRVVQVQLKRGRAVNELNCYRYDVVIQKGEHGRCHPACQTLVWEEDVGAVELERALSERVWSALHVRMIPNLRLSRELAAQSLIDAAEDHLDAASLRAMWPQEAREGVDPDYFWELGEAHGYTVQVDWAPGDGQGRLDVLFFDRALGNETFCIVDDDARKCFPWTHYASDPMGSVFRQRLVPALREHLKRRLPDYMLPAAWVVLDELPLTTSGKVDRRALPPPEERSEGFGTYVPPRTELECTVAGIWAQVLGVDRVGLSDNFFELGGHSLLIVRLLEQLRQVGLVTTVSSLYAKPRLRDFTADVSSKDRDVISIPPNGIPLGCTSITADMISLVDLEPEHIERITREIPGGSANIQDIYPLTALQEGMLFHYLLDQSKGDVYVRCRLFSIESRETLETFIEALQMAIDRHDVLRTAVLWEGLPKALQVVCRQALLPVEVIPPSARIGALEALKEYSVPEERKLDFHSAPLMRLLAVADGASGRWYALLQTHHIVCDNESAQILFSEIIGHLNGRIQSELPRPAPYREHVAEAIAYTHAHNAEEYFRHKLGDVDEATAPYGVLDVHGSGSGVAVSSGSLSASLARTLAALARRLAVSPASIFHAAWALVVSATSGRDDVVFGTVLLGRMQGGAGAKPIVGMFINTLPLRVQLCGATATSMVEGVHRDLADLLVHEHAPLAMAQRCSAVDVAVPLFTAVLNYRHATEPRSSTEFSGASGVTLLESYGNTNYPIVLSVSGGAETFALEVEANCGIDPRRVLGYVQTAIKSLVRALEESPREAALELDVVPEDEQKEAIGGLPRPREQEGRRELIHEVFEAQVGARPEAIAVSYERETLTYAELNGRANQLARHLIQRGVGPDKLVGICIGRSLDMVVAVLGILKAGCAYVPIDPMLPRDRVSWVLRDAALTVVLVQQSTKECCLGDAAELVALDSEWPRIAEQRVDNIELESTGLTSTHLAYVIYTSGSTGTPKGVMVTHDNVVRLFRATECCFAFNSRDVWTMFHSFAFDFSVWELWGGLFYGGRVIVVPSATARAPDDTFELLCSEGVTILNQTPSAFYQLAEAQSRCPDLKHSLRMVIFGGEPLECHRLKEWVSRNGADAPLLVNMYGITETTVHVTYRRLSMEDIQAEGASVIGSPIQDLTVGLLDRHHRAVPLGVVGEIYVGGAGLARGYLGRPELTAERFIRHPFSSDPGVMLYKTGDLGRRRADGILEYCGRNDDQVKIRGYRVELGEISAHLARHPDVKEAVTVARDDEAKGRRLVGYVIPKTGSTVISVESLRAHLKESLPEYMIPSAFVVLWAFPLTPNGKLDRRSLPAPQEDAYGSRKYVAPQGDVEEVLAGIWQDLLDVERVGRSDNFFELGGHSLLVVQLMERIRRAGLRASVRRIFESTTLTELAGTITPGSVEQLDVPPNGIPLGCKEIAPGMLSLISLDIEHIEEITRTVLGGAPNVQDIYPLAPLQEGILFHHLLSSDNGDVYTRPMLFSVSCAERLKEFVVALQAIIDRHDSLRTAVLWERLPQPVQVVHRRATLPVESVALERDRPAAQQLIEQMSSREVELDLRRPPMMKVHIAQDPDGDHWYALLCTHHLVCDNVSLEILLNEIAAHLEGRQHSLPAPVPYRNHVAQALAHTKSQSSEAFFRSKLGMISHTTAPFDLVNVRGNGGEIQGAKGAVTQELMRRLRSEARRLNVSAGTMFHAAWALVVSQTSRHEDIVYGTVLLGRFHGSAGAQRILGMFVNTLPLRLNLRGVTAKGLIEMTNVELMDLLGYEQASLAVAQRCSGVSGPNPLFSALLNYRRNGSDVAKQAFEVDGVTLVGGRGRTNYPLALSVEDGPQECMLYIEADRRVNPERVLRYVEAALESLVKALEESPGKLAAALQVLPDCERQEVIEEFGGVRRYRKGSLIHELFEEQVRRSPSAVALICGADSLTYAQLNERANQVGWFLRESGVATDQIVGICAERSFEMVIGLLGILKAGGAYMPLDPEYPQERLTYMLEKATPRIILTQQRFRQNFAAAAGVAVSLDSEWALIGKCSPENVRKEPPELRSNQLAYVIYTSGSTGRPKGAMNEHGAVANRLLWMQEQYGLDERDVILQKTPFSFDVSVWEFFWPLISGARVVLCRPGGHRDPAYLRELIEERRVTTLHFVPSMLQVFLDEVDLGCCPSIRRIVCSGEELPVGLMNRCIGKIPQARLANLYGPTECAVDVTAWECFRDESTSRVPIGHAIANSRIYILNGDLEPVPIGVSGEIYIGGAQVGRGYLGDPELTAERFMPDPFTMASGARMYKTGDLGRWREDGAIEYLGRNDDQVKIRGFRIELGEIEVQLARHPDVKDAAVLARGDKLADRYLVGYVTLTDRASVPTSEELRAHLRAVLPEHMVPSTFVMLREFPLTRNGKLDRKSLPAPDLDVSLSCNYVAPQGDVEVGLAAIWKTVLNVDRVGRHDNFFELGGHSLTGMKLIGRVKHAFGVSLPMGVFFRYPTIEQMGVLMTRLLHTTAGVLPATSGSDPLSEQTGSSPSDLAKSNNESSYLTGLGFWP